MPWFRRTPPPLPPSDRHVDVSGYPRYTSSDARFAFSIRYPSEARANFHRFTSGHLCVDFDAHGETLFSVSFNDLRWHAERDRDAKAVVEGRKDHVWYVNQELAERKNAPEGPEGNPYKLHGDYWIMTDDADLVTVGGARCAWVLFSNRQGQYDGERIFFWRRSRPDELWGIGYRSAYRANHFNKLDHATFRAILATFED